MKKGLLIIIVLVLLIISGVLYILFNQGNQEHTEGGDYWNTLIVYKTNGDYTNNISFDKSLRDVNLDEYYPAVDYIREPIISELSEGYIYNSELTGAYSVDFNNIVFLDMTYSEYNGYVKTYFVTEDTNDEQYRYVLKNLGTYYPDKEPYDLEDIDRQIVDHLLTIDSIAETPFIEVYNCKYLNQQIKEKQDKKFIEIMDNCFSDNDVGFTMDDFERYQKYLSRTYNVDLTTAAVSELALTRPEYEIDPDYNRYYTPYFECRSQYRLNSNQTNAQITINALNQAIESGKFYRKCERII